jgi:hypothetical protein
MNRAIAICGGIAVLFHATAQPAQAQFEPNWSGLYAGLQAGFARGRSSFDGSDLSQAGFTSSPLKNPAVEAFPSFAGFRVC